MGTFTLAYFVRTVFWDKKGYWLTVFPVYHFGRCWDNAGYAKVEMMKVGLRTFWSSIRSC
ncbi:unnamed protein product [Angiostrongylus costaricensis]|uniref:Inner membrane protein n=1 Tax=Angiostrongylus costaricensis TaxID=334426 RepID=A0A0R3P9J4_ANGCS|nr:unnamed protein product [Angiostrongylus costaricensis]